MATFKCPGCGKKTSGEMSRCVECGTVFHDAEPTNDKNKIRSSALISFILTATLGVVLIVVAVAQLLLGDRDTFKAFLALGIALICIGYFTQIRQHGARINKGAQGSSHEPTSTETTSNTGASINPVEGLYTERENTPFKWHRFLCWFAFPLSILTNIIYITSFDITSFDHAVILIQIVLTATVIWGLSQFKRFGYVLFHGLYTFIILSIFASVISGNFTAESIGTLIGCLVVVIPTMIYYRKRRLLFT